MDQPGTDGFFQPGKLEADEAALDDMAARIIAGKCHCNCNVHISVKEQTIPPAFKYVRVNADVRSKLC